MSSLGPIVDASMTEKWSPTVENFLVFLRSPSKFRLTSLRRFGGPRFFEEDALELSRCKTISPIMSSIYEDDDSYSGTIESFAGGYALGFLLNSMLFMSSKSSWS